MTAARRLRWRETLLADAAIMSAITTTPAEAAPTRPRRIATTRVRSARTATGACARSLSPGEGRVVFERVDGATALVSCAAASPLQILSPRRRGPSACAVLSSHGGGLVSGDWVALSVEVGEGARGLIATQAEGKVFRSSALSRLSLEARVATGALLAYLPDPVSCFGGARYLQEQRFDLERGAGLVLVDAVTAGRTARGERWALETYLSRTEVTIGGELVLRDVLELDRDRRLEERMGRFTAFALALAVGPALAAHSKRLLDVVGAAPAKRLSPLCVTASPLADGVLVRLGAQRVEDLASALREHLSFLSTELHEDPFIRRW